MKAQMHKTIEDTEKEDADKTKGISSYARNYARFANFVTIKE